MANEEHLKILRQGVEAWNKWRETNPDIQPNLRQAKLRKAKLREIDFSRADLSGADLGKANLYAARLWDANLIDADLSGTFLFDANLMDAYLIRANLSGADLQGADLSAVDFTDANLSGADLSDADLVAANLSDANLSGADFSHARVGWTTFGNADLSMVKGLETVHHAGPSTIGIDTIYRSKGNIPEVFLRGAGVPDDFFAYMKSLAGKPIPFLSCFISYSSKDKGFCDRLYADLQSNGVRAWYFPEDAKWGETVWGEIDRGIKTYDKVVVVCSKNSLQSAPVLREIERGLRREDEEGKNILFPITIDNYIFDVWEHERKTDVLTKVVGDFRGWKRSAAKYEAALKKLLEALKAE